MFPLNSHKCPSLVARHLRIPLRPASVRCCPSSTLAAVWKIRQPADFSSKPWDRETPWETHGKPWQLIGNGSCKHLSIGCFTYFHILHSLDVDDVSSDRAVISSSCFPFVPASCPISPFFSGCDELLNWTTWSPRERIPQLEWMNSDVEILCIYMSFSGLPALWIMLMCLLSHNCNTI